ncbi:aldo/keto reductase [Streptomyces sp. NPDC002851]
MKESVPVGRAADQVESDVVDLSAVSVGTVRGLPIPAPSDRMLAEMRRPRHNAVGGGPAPGVAE